jgi:hypothetical protein
MPEYSAPVLEKISDLQVLPAGERRPAEVVAIFWPDNTKIYASAMYTEHPWWPDLAAAIETEFGEEIPITLTLIPDGRTPFRDLPRTASVSDDSISLTFSDFDDEFSDLLMTYGEGIRLEVFGYWPAVDLLLSMWRGILSAPKDMNRSQVKVSAVAGWRSPQMLVPRRPHATSCTFIFGAHYATQAEIDQSKGCPYNAHLTELERGGAPLIGVPGFTDCPRRVKADCSERLTEPDTATATERFWPGFETRPDPIPNNQTKGPNLLARSIGNESSLNDPIRAIFGERHIKAANLLAFRNETNNNHPEDGFFAGLFEFGEGPMLALWEFRMMGQLVGAEHLQLRLGELGQQPSDWSPDVNSYSGTAHGYGRIQGEPDNATASDYSASIRSLGLKDIRVYSDADTFVEGFTRNRMWCLLHILAHLRWGYGQDYPRYDIDSAIEVAAWCDETVSVTDPNGNVFSGIRSTFNAEVTARAIQQQVKDICTAGRIGLPFEFNGKDVFVPLRAEDTSDPDIPAFTDEGPTRNIVYSGAESSLEWSYISDDTLTNQWTVNFDDASNSGVDTQLVFGDQPQQLRAGRAWGDRSKRVLSKSQSAFGITNADEAARFGLSLLFLGPLDSGGILNPWSVKFSTWYTHAFRVQNYKLIRVQNAKLQSKIAAYSAARGLSPYPGADYTYFRVMKYIRKGNLQVDIEAQLYATFEEVPYTPTCETSLLAPVVWGEFSNIEETDDGELIRDGGTPGTNDSWARSEFLVDGDSCARWEIRTFFDRPETNNDIYFVIEDELGGANKYGWHLMNETVDFRMGARHGVTQDFEVYYGPQGVDDLNQVGYNVGFRFGIHYDNGTVTLYRNQQWATNTDTLVEPSSFSGLDTTKQWRLRVFIFSASGVATPAFETNGSLVGGIGAPRDFRATVNAATGLVQLSWSPPLIGPELVTGYHIRQGTSTIMAPDLVYNYSLTLTPGTYTYRVRGEGDGPIFGANAYVTFTVPEPTPDTLTLIDRDSGNIFIDRETGDIMVSRAVPGG